MTSVHSEMERSELLITFEEHRNIWTRTSFAPVFAALFTASAAAVAYSRGSHWPCSGTAGLGPNTVFTPIASKVHREQGPVCSLYLLGSEWGKEPHCCTSGTSDGETGPSYGPASHGSVSLNLTQRTHSRQGNQSPSCVGLLKIFISHFCWKFPVKNYRLLKKPQQTQNPTPTWP